jgi:hypothetical protein
LQPLPVTGPTKQVRCTGDFCLTLFIPVLG